MKKADLEMLQKITEMQSHAALARLGRAADKLTTIQMQQEVVQHAKVQARKVAANDPEMGSCAERFCRWASLEAQALHDQRRDEQRAFELSKADAMRAFGRKRAVESLRQR